jgi:uncharacterized protein (DUF1697 family)
MARYVAFLRAINVGGRRVKMERLRAAFEDLGFEDVETHIASGNVIFTGTGGRAKLERRIEAGLERELGFDVMTFVRSAKQVAEIAGREPFGDLAPGHTHMVALLRSAPAAGARAAAEGLSGAKDELKVHGSELHWLIRGKSMASEVKAPQLRKALDGDPGTTRNTTMLRKLAAKLDA